MAEPHRTLSERAHPLLEEAAERSRESARARAERLRDTARAILQATLAATLAWPAGLSGRLPPPVAVRDAAGVYRPPA